MISPTPALSAHGLTRVYRDGERSLTVLDNVSLNIYPGERVAIVGPSGSGKSTLLGLLAGLDVPSAGTVAINGQDLASLSPSALAAFRGAALGFVFQSHRLLPHCTAWENVRIPLELRADSGDHRTIASRAQAALERVGLGQRLHHRPSQLSGGEQQRVAIARALVASPAVILADEPTGNLDRSTGATIEALLFSVTNKTSDDRRPALVVVTHDLNLAERAERVLELQDGRLVADRRGADPAP